MEMPSETSVTDSALPALPDALDCRRASAAFAVAKPFAGAYVVVQSATLRRHKPGRRAVIDYLIDVRWRDGRRERVEAIGKMRASHQPRTGYRLLRQLWRSGFAADSVDGISVPEPVGVVPALDLWLQRRVVGELATVILPTARGVWLAARVADAAHKLHRAGVATEKAHGAAAELAILERVLAEMTARTPALGPRMARLLDGCRALATELDTATAGIHRDFYADQVMVADGRLYLLDFDLYCQGHAALDIGNFAGHLIEQGLRAPAQAPALDAARGALESRFRLVAGETSGRAVRIYTALTLARHVYLSAVVPGRRATTGRVLDAALDLVETLRR